MYVRRIHHGGRQHSTTNPTVVANLPARPLALTRHFNCFDPTTKTAAAAAVPSLTKVNPASWMMLANPTSNQTPIIATATASIVPATGLAATLVPTTPCLNLIHQQQQQQINQIVQQQQRVGQDETLRDAENISDIDDESDLDQWVDIGSSGHRHHHQYYQQTYEDEDDDDDESENMKLAVEKCAIVGGHDGGVEEEESSDGDDINGRSDEFESEELDENEVERHPMTTARRRPSILVGRKIPSPKTSTTAAAAATTASHPMGILKKKSSSLNSKQRPNHHQFNLSNHHHHHNYHQYNHHYHHGHTHKLFVSAGI